MPFPRTIGHFGPGAGGAPGPPNYPPPQPPGGGNIGGPPSWMGGGTSTFPGPGSGGAPGPPNYPPSPPPGGGSNIPGPPEWMGGGGDVMGRGFGSPGGQIGPPTQENSLGQGGWGEGHRDSLAEMYRRMGYNFGPTPSNAPMSNESINSQYPGANAGGPIQGPQNRMRTGGTGNIESRSPAYNPQMGGGRPSRGGSLYTPQMGGMGGGMSFQPRPVPGPRASGPYTPFGEVVLPHGTNPWDIPGATTPFGEPILPPGDRPGQFPYDLSQRMGEGMAQHEALKDRFREFVAGGGDPYGGERPDLPGWQPQSEIPQVPGLSPQVPGGAPLDNPVANTGGAPGWQHQGPGYPGPGAGGAVPSPYTPPQSPGGGMNQGGPAQWQPQGSRGSRRQRFLA